MVPWQLLIIIIIILAIVGFIGWFGLKKYNQWITKKAIKQFGAMQLVQKSAIIKDGNDKEIMRKLKNMKSSRKTTSRKKNV